MKTPENFYQNTYAKFTRVRMPHRKPDYISYKKIVLEGFQMDSLKNHPEWSVIEKTYYGDYLVQTDRISSRYWYTNEGVFRASDHWGNSASCFWELENQTEQSKVGFCYWKDFYDIIDYVTADHQERCLPIIPSELIGKENIAIAFNELHITTIKNLSAPIDGHPRHFSNTIRLIHYLESI